MTTSGKEAMYEVLIFDLGGVLFEIELERALKAFRKLAKYPETLTEPKAFLSQELFRSLEKGTLSPSDFRSQVRSTYDIEGTDAEIDAAWNALLIAPFEGRAAVLRELSKSYRLFLLSNTNRIHYDVFKEPCKELFEPFEQLIFSFETGFSKPGSKIYQHTLDLIQAPPEKCLFIDDSKENLDGAAHLGIKTSHIFHDTDFQKLAKLLLKIKTV